MTFLKKINYLYIRSGHVMRWLGLASVTSSNTLIIKSFMSRTLRYNDNASNIKRLSYIQI